MKQRIRHSPLYLWWYWRKAPKREYPLRYVGPDTQFIQYGIPLVSSPGSKGAIGGKRYASPDGIIRVLNRKQVIER